MFFENYYLNYYTLTMLSTFILSFVSGLAFLLVPSRSKPTLFLGLGILGAALFIFGYVLSQGFYLPSVWSRVFLLMTISLHQLLMLQFALRFPDYTEPKITKLIFRVHFFLWFLIATYVLYSGITSSVVFDFEGDHFDFYAPKFYKIFGISSLVGALAIFLVSFWKIFRVTKEDRKAMIIITIGQFSVEIIAAILNILNRLGTLNRTAFIGSFALLITISFFIIIVTYINKTKDRTSFMFKVVGVSFVSFLLIFNFMILAVFQEVEKNYDSVHKTKAELIIENKKFDGIDSLSYLDINTGEYIKLYTKVSHTKETNYSQELFHSYIYNEIEKENPDIEKLLQLFQNPYSFDSFLYKNLLESEKNREVLLSDFISLRKNIRKLKTKLEEFPVENFRSHLQEFIQKNGIPNAILQEVAQNVLKLELEGVELKKKLYTRMQPITDLETRKNREDLLTKEHSFVFHIYKKEENRMYEVAFPYLEYRKVAHAVGSKLFGLLIAGLILFVVGSPIFLSGTLINPLKVLLEGLRQVRKGYLTVSIPVRFQDEIGFISGYFNSMVKSIFDAKVKLDEYTETLEEKVNERTKELQLTLSQVEKLKNQQDGDYFLTTLLLKPLGVKNINSDKVFVDFFVRQKKEFSFKSQNHYIGGDLCVSQEVTLKGKKYITFLNGDAMGKSMQGAGGILVLGAVFQSIIQRTLSYRAYSEMVPEYWIKTAFKEMHKVFESFDGSMLVSIVFGLVDEETGLVYYINAEHPWVILYRDGTANFIEDHLKFRKLGTAGLYNEIYVSIFQLCPGDTLLIGSDGKDDLILYGENKERLINEDEKLFLTNVAKADGNLEEIYSLISSHYELMDDFSLLSIQYRATQKSIVSNSEEVEQVLEEAKVNLKNQNLESAISILENAKNREDMYEAIVPYLIKLYLHKNNFTEASKLTSEYLRNREHDTSFLLKAAMVFKANRELDLAIELSERVKLREPTNIRNLLNLADLYTFTGNTERAEKILQKIFVLDSDNSRARKIKEELEKRKKTVNSNRAE